MRDFFSRLSRKVGLAVAHPAAFMLAVLGVIVWAALGPALHYSDQWQLVINTSTTILTFLMVFLLQNTQNRDSRSVQVKLDELLRAVDGARNEMIELEELSEDELSRYCREFHELHLHYAKELAGRGKTDLVREAVNKSRQKVGVAELGSVSQSNQQKTGEG